MTRRAIAMAAGAVLSCAGQPGEVSYRTLPVCKLTTDASALVEAEVVSIGTAQDIPSEGNVAGLRATPVQVKVTRVLWGSGPASSTVWIGGEVDATGNAAAGKLKPLGKFASGYFFLSQFCGKSFSYGGNGVFLREGAMLANPTSASGLDEAQFLSESAHPAAGCPAATP